MLRKLHLTKITLLIIVFSLMIPNLVSKGAEAKDFQFKYGTSTITGKLLDDFSKSVVDQERVWKEGFIELKDGKVFCEGVSLADCYLITIPDANENKNMYIEAKYIGVEISNKSDGDIYYCFQGTIDGIDALTSPLGENNVILVDKNGVKYDVVFSSSSNVYERYAFIIPNGFDGYVLISTTNVTRRGVWDKSIWKSSMNIDGIGVHVSLGENTTPIVDATFVEFTLDNFFIFNGQLPEYEVPITPEPTEVPTPEPTEVPTPSPTPKATNTDNKKTNQPGETSTRKGDFPLLAVIIGAVVLIAIVILILILRKKKK